MTHTPDLAGSAFKAAPYEHYAWLREQAPVHRVQLRNGSMAWLVSRYDDAIAVLGGGHFFRGERGWATDA